MNLSVDELRELFERVPSNGDVQAGLVLADALEELGYPGAARRLNELLKAIAPIEVEIVRRGLSEGPETQALYQPIRGPWRRLKKRVMLALWLESKRRAGRPFAWFNLDAGGIGPKGNRVKRGNSYPVIVRDRLRGTAGGTRDPMVGVEFVEAPPVDATSFAFASQPRLLAVRRDALSAAPRFYVAPGGGIFREVFR